MNADDANSAVMVQNTRATKRSYAVRNMAIYDARIIENQLSGLHLSVDGHDLYARLVGEFNASNLLAVYSVALSCWARRRSMCSWRSATSSRRAAASRCCGAGEA